MKTITLKFQKDGKCHLETNGFKGEGCIKATEFLKSLGKSTDIKEKAEYYEKNIELNDINTEWCG